MKTIFLITIVLFFTAFISCGKKDYVYTWSQYVQNSTNHSCKLFFYTNKFLRDSLVIVNANSAFILEDEIEGAFVFDPFNSVLDKIYYDSLIIHFDDNKNLTYSRNGINTRNIFKKENYTENIEKKNATYIYTITPQDYQNAIPGK